MYTFILFFKRNVSFLLVEILMPINYNINQRTLTSAFWYIKPELYIRRVRQTQTNAFMRIHPEDSG
jgi:hypothetical protein